MNYKIHDSRIDYQYVPDFLQQQWRGVDGEIVQFPQQKYITASIHVKNTEGVASRLSVFKLADGSLWIGTNRDLQSEFTCPVEDLGELRDYLHPITFRGLKTKRAL
jgi:hypothetical protein